MEKIKNLVNPGSKQDNEILYGSGRADDPGSTVPTSGQGSHLSSSNTAGNDPISSTTEPLSTSGYKGSNTIGNDPLSSSTEPSSTTGYGGNTIGTGYSTNQPPGYGNTEDGVNDPYSASRTQGTPSDVATTASIKSGIAGLAQSGSLTGSPGTHDTLDTNKPLPNEPEPGLSGISSSTTAGPHSSSLANKADPRVDSDLDGSKGLGSNSGDGIGLTSSSLPDRSVGNSGYGSQVEPSQSSHLGRDAALGAGTIGAGTAAAHHHDHDRDNIGSDSGRSFPLGGNSTTSDSAYPSDSTGLGSSTTAGPHSSNLANKADPRVDSDLDGSRGIGNTGYGSGTGPTAGSDHRGTLGHDSGLGSEIETGAASTSTGSGLDNGPESWQHEHRKHGHQFQGDPCGPEESVQGAPHFTTGPHATDTANRLDPKVASDITAPTESTNTSSGSTLGSAAYGDQHGRDASLAAGAAGVGTGAYESSRDTPSSTDPATSTTGPLHKSSLLNKLDPRVKSTQQDSSEFSETPGDTGSTTTSAADKDHYHGRDAGLAGAGGAAGYEAEKHLGSHEPTGTTSSTGISNPYSTSELDPRVNPEHTAGSSTLGSPDTTRPDKDHHYGRDAGLVGAGGVAAYEAEKHLGKDNKSSEISQIPESVGGPSYDRSIKPGSGYEQTPETIGDQSKGFVGTGAGPQSGTGPHHGRDAGLTGAGLGAGGVTAYEAEKHHDRDQGTTTDPSYPSSRYEKSDDTHAGRDAALASGAGAGLGAAAEPEFSKKEAEKLEKEHNKEIEKEQKAIHKDQVKHEKEIEKEAKKHDKAIAKEEKAIAKEEKKHDDGKKHGGILGLFHRDKPDKDLKDEEYERQTGGTHHGAETAAGVGTAAAVGAEVENEKDKHERNRLHKDPPAGYLDSQKYGEKPEGGYASQVTGGTGTTALAEGENLPGGPHLTEMGNKADPFVPDRGDLIAASEAPGQSVTEPHTGLPMDLSKGSGAGGTDDGTMPGYHAHGSTTEYDTSTGGVTHGSGAPTSGTTGIGGAGNDIAKADL